MIIAEQVVLDWSRLTAGPTGRARVPRYSAHSQPGFAGVAKSGGLARGPLGLRLLELAFLMSSARSAVRTSPAPGPGSPGNRRWHAGDVVTAETLCGGQAG
jgi:hypothetical protein